MARPGICLLCLADTCTSEVHPVFNPVAPYRYLLPNLYLYVADIANPDLLACGSRTWISLDIARFYEEHFQPSSGSAWPAFPKHANRVPIDGGGRGRHNLHKVCQTAVTAPPRVCCVVWSHKSSTQKYKFSKYTQNTSRTLL